MGDELGGKRERLVSEWLGAGPADSGIGCGSWSEQQVGDFKKLIVWREAHELATGIYKATRAFPVEERFGLTAQLRRSAASIPANIAEGCGRNADRELRRFVRISIGSATELEYHLLLAGDVGLLDPQTFIALSGHAVRIQGMLVALERILKQSLRKPIAHSP